MLSTQTAGALVGVPASRERPPVAVEALRPFMLAGERVEIGVRRDVPHQVAAELIAAQKARIAPAVDDEAATRRQGRRKQETAA
jgi:hypothetical protein